MGARQAFIPEEGSLSKSALELVFSNVYSPFRSSSISGLEYYINLKLTFQYGDRPER